MLLPMLLLSALTFFATPAQPPGWRGIIPLHSTRDDVRRELGASKAPNSRFYDLYNLKNETVYISYADGSCGGGWKVQRGTVISINVAPKTKLGLAELQLSDKYEKRSNPHLPEITFYVNEEDGITVQAVQDEVTKIYYGPATRDKRLRCSEQPSAKVEGNLPHADSSPRPRGVGRPRH